MIHERDRQLTAVVQEAAAVEDIESAAIFVVAPGTGTLQLVAGKLLAQAATVNMFGLLPVKFG